MLNRLLNSGIHSGLSFPQKNKISVFNTACTLVMGISSFYLIYGLLFRYYLAASVSVFFMTSIIAAMYLISKRKYSAAFHVGLICSFIFLTGFTMLFGNESKAYFYFLFMPVASTILFDSFKVSVRYIIVSVLCLLLNVVFIEYSRPYYDVHGLWYFSYPNMIFTVMLIFMGLRVFKHENLKYATQIEEQKHSLQEKNTEMTDSINYARRIQYTLLASQQLLDNGLPEHFILFKPKDIVSGDFYWAAQKGDLFYLAICDSTGHGVPGAFMSLLNISFLNEALNENPLVRPNEILNYVRKRLIETVSQEGAKDGMDAVLICYDKQGQRVDYAAANNAPLLIRNNEAKLLAKDKMPVGQGEKTDPFTMHSIHLQPGDVLYLFTDGLADQFGGPAGKKFKIRQLEDLLLKTHWATMTQQKMMVEDSFKIWKGNLEQVDDICMIGIRF